MAMDATGQGIGEAPNRPPVRSTNGHAGLVPAAGKVFTFLSIAALYLLARRWREKARNSTPIHVVTPSEIAAVLSLLASLVYLVPRLLGRSRRFWE